MNYWGLFWETGMPEAWALSRKSGDKPGVEVTPLPQLQAMLDPGAHPAMFDPANVVPGDNAGRPVPTPEDGKPKG